MIYIAIDNSSSTAQKMVQLIEEMSCATVYREFNKTTQKAFKEIEGNTTIKAKDAHELLAKLKL